MHSIIVILGPTASGKSALGVSLARRFSGVVVSADSRQVYRGLDLCFGTVTRREMRGVRHYLLRYIPLKRQYTAGEYARTFQRVLRRIPKRTPIFLVGGSPFYIEAALQPERLASVPPKPSLRRKLERRSTRSLFSVLRSLDPRRASTIDPQNRRRLIRAIEIASTHPKPQTRNPKPLRVLKLGLSLPRATLYQRIDQRVGARMQRGMLEEVVRAQKRGLSWRRLDSFGLEPRYFSRILRGQVSHEDGIRQLESAIHDFARRQLTWWRRDRSIHWIRSAGEAERLIRRFWQRRAIDS